MRDIGTLSRGSTKLVSGLHNKAIRRPPYSRLPASWSPGLSDKAHITIRLPTWKRLAGGFPSKIKLPVTL
jgi:hypothetical protein